jgi:hypothetical protein
VPAGRKPSYIASPRVLALGLAVALLSIAVVASILKGRQVTVSPASLATGGEQRESLQSPATQDRSGSSPTDVSEVTRRTPQDESPRSNADRAVVVTSALGINLEDVQFREPGEEGWVRVPPSNDGAYVLRGSAHRYPIEIRAKAHGAQLVAEEGKACILEPDSSLQLVIEGAPNPVVNDWSFAENVAQGTALRANLEEAVHGGVSSAGFAIAIDVDQFEEVLGAAASANMRVLLVSGHELRVRWKPTRGQQIVEVLDQGLAGLRPATTQELEILSWPGDQRADRAQMFDCELIELTDATSVVIERTWGSYEVQWRGVGSLRESGAGLVVFPRAFLESRYCVIAMSEDGTLYGRQFFTCNGARVVMRPEFRNRVKGTLRHPVQGGGPVHGARLEVLYEGAQLGELHNLATPLVVNNDAGDFDVVACSEPLANEGVPFPAPRTAIVRVTAPGFAAWEAQVTWPGNGSTADLGVIVLASGTADLLLHPLQGHRDSSWYAVYPPGGKKEIVVKAARLTGESVALVLEGESPSLLFDGVEELLVPRDALSQSISGFTRGGEIWWEVEQDRYVFEVSSAAPIQEGELLALGLEWRGVLLPFGSFDAADFRNASGLQRFEVIAPSEGLRLWGQRLDSSGKSQGMRTEIMLAPGSSRHAIP